VNGPRNLVLAVMFVILAAGFSTASDIYIAQNAAGGNNGADCADAHSVSWFNSSANWGSGAGLIGPGATAHLCGIITSELSFHGSGTSGNVIALVFETGAKIQITPGMDSNGIINIGGNSYITIDGGVGQPCGWNTATNASEGSCNGQIENMQYGSSDGVCPAGTCTTQYNVTNNNMIQGSGSNIEIRNLNIGPAYVHTSTGNGGNDAGGTGCIGDSSGSNWNIHDNKLHDGLWCVNIMWLSGTTSNVTVANNELYNNSHMLAVAGQAALNGFTLSGNNLHDMYNWDTASDYDHADAIHFFTSSGVGTIQNVAIYNNIFGGNTGGDVTGQIFNEDATTYTNFVMFNNLFTMSTTPNLGASGHVWGPAQCNSGCYFLNNTIARQTVTGGNLDLGYSSFAMSATIENNVNQGASWLATVSASSPSLTLDYNAYGPYGDGWQYRGSTYGTLASWDSASGEGTHSFYNSNLSLNGTFAPASGSPLVGAGVNVCTQNPTFCTNYPAIKNDLAGNARPTSGNWNIGAYQNPSTGTSPAPPTGLAAVVQ
jgi:hypothetical protein